MNQQVDFSASQPALGRMAAFWQGQSGTPDNTVSSLDKRSQIFNEAVPGTFQPQSVLNQFTPSSNGWAKTNFDSQVLAGGYALPSPDGSDPETYRRNRLMRLMGENV